MGRLFGVGLLAIVSFLALADVAAADILLGTTGSGGTPSTLVELDPGTGAVLRVIGPVGYTVNGLTWDPTTGRLYAGTSVNDPSFNGLIQIDLVTGAGTPVGAPFWGAGLSTPITNITVDSTGQMYGWTESGDDLVVIDKTTGVATVVGESGVGTGANGLSFDPADTLWMVNFGGGGVYQVDTTSGATSYIGELGATAHHGDFDPVSGFWFGIDSPGSGPKSLVVADLSVPTVVGIVPSANDLHALTFVPRPRLFGTLGQGGTPSTLVELDPVTGALVQVIGPVGYGVNGLTYDATTGKLYGGTRVGDPLFNGLIEIDMTTGAGTPVGAPNWGDASSVPITNLTSDSAGNLYAWSEVYDSLMSVDKGTGVATLVGSSGIGTAMYGLSFDRFDALWLVNTGGTVYSVDPGTGLATTVGPLPVSLAHHGDFDPITGLYYGIDASGGSGPRNLVLADLPSLTVPSTLPTVDDLHTLTFVTGGGAPAVVPIADAGLDQTFEWVPGGISVTLDGSGSSDPLGGALTYLWTGPFDGGTATGVNPTVTFSGGVGTYVVTLVVDNGSASSVPDTMQVILQDTTPPTVRASLAKNLLWLPRWGMIDVMLQASASDVADPAPVISVEVRSDEAAGAPPYSPDASVTGRTLRLRAERDSLGNGRVYVVLVTATDASGNSATAPALSVVVPLNLTVQAVTNVRNEAAALVLAPPPEVILPPTALAPPP